MPSLDLLTVGIRSWLALGQASAHFLGIIMHAQSTCLIQWPHAWGVGIISRFDASGSGIGLLYPNPAIKLNCTLKSRLMGWLNLGLGVQRRVEWNQWMLGRWREGGSCLSAHTWLAKLLEDPLHAMQERGETLRAASSVPSSQGNVISLVHRSKVEVDYGIGRGILCDLYYFLQNLCVVLAFQTGRAI